MKTLAKTTLLSRGLSSLGSLLTTAALIGAFTLTSSAARAQHLDVKDGAQGRSGGDYSFDMRLEAGKRISRMNFGWCNGFQVMQNKAVFRSGADAVLRDVSGRDRVGVLTTGQFLDVPEDDYIAQVTIAWTDSSLYEALIEGLRVTTAKGASVTYGTMSPRPFPARHYFERPGYEIVGFHGKASSGSIQSLGVYWRPVDEATAGTDGQAGPIKVLPVGERVAAVNVHRYAAGTKFAGLVFEGRTMDGSPGTTLTWGVLAATYDRFEIPVDDYLKDFMLIRDSANNWVGVQMTTYRGRRYLRGSGTGDSAYYPTNYEVVGLVGDPRGLAQNENLVRVLRVRTGYAEYYTGSSQCPGNGRLAMSTSPRPVLGVTVGFTASSSTMSAIALLGFAKAEVPMPGACDLLVANPIALPMSTQYFAPLIRVQVPDDPSFFMSSIYGQAFCLEDGPTLGAGVLTQGVQFAIGAR
ncbi:MAG: jacalin-like lectin [Planctomycetota bacterium]